MPTTKGEQTEPLTRRQMLTVLTAVSSTLILSSLPNQWHKPRLKIGILPAHAQTSPSPTHSLTPETTPDSTPTLTPITTPATTITPTPPTPASTETPFPYS